MSKHIGILTSGGDCPGLNAAIRGLCKTGEEHFDMRFTGFLDGFRGLMQDRSIPLTGKEVSGILTDGGTLLGTSRDKPHRMNVDGKIVDMTDSIVETYNKHGLDALVCLGGGGTQKNALRLHKRGLNIMTLPKTIDNDIFGTDISFGFNTALGIATDAIDRLHSTATSHHRIIVVEIMGHRAGWLALGAGIAGGADVILIPEIPYSLDYIAKAIEKRKQGGKKFSIVAVAEGCISQNGAKKIEKLLQKKAKAKTKKERLAATKELEDFHAHHVDHTLHLTRQLEEATGQESRLTILGHLQRGGTPSAFDRLLSTRLGARCAAELDAGNYGTMLALVNEQIEPLPLETVAGQKKLVSPDHPWVLTARRLGTSLGDE